MVRYLTPRDITQRLDWLPRLQLASLPTPLDSLDRLSADLGGPAILAKHEDLTGPALGGNKIREFEFSLAQAVESGCDVLVHRAAAQSNQSRVTAAAAARLGMVQLAGEVCRLLDFNLYFEPDDFEICSDFVGPDYGVATDEGLEAIDLAARCEGLLLDPSYTGKAMAALLSHIREGRWTGADNVIFVHTGGIPALFAYVDDLQLQITEI